MAVMDVAWFRPDLIDPASDVPIGIGAIPFLRLLANELGPELSHPEIFARIIELQRAPAMANVHDTRHPI